jgi:hypothetical protein
MPATAIEIGGLSFPTKEAAADFFRSILYCRPIGSPIPEPDATALHWLLERHPSFPSKVGVGIAHFSIRMTPYGMRGFEIVRIDGTATDFSFLKCLAGKDRLPLAKALQAMRAEVGEDIAQRKREWFQDHGDAGGRVPCTVTGALVTIDQAHADHAPPRTFGTLAVAFLEARELDPSALIAPSADNQYGARLIDRAVADAWRAYHHKLAVVRIVSKSVNLGSAHQGKVRTKDRQHALPL